MGLKVSIDHPHFPKGTEFGINGIGLIKNGGSVTLTEEQEATFVAERGGAAKDLLGNDGITKVEGSAEVTGKKLNELTGEGGGE